MRLDGNQIKVLRAAKGISQATLATMSDVSERTIQRAEKGLSIRPETLPFIADALGVDAEILKLKEVHSTPEQGSDTSTVMPPPSLKEYVDGKIDEEGMHYRSKVFALLGLAGGSMIMIALGWGAYDWFGSQSTLRWQVGWSLFFGGVGVFLLSRVLDWFLFIRLETSVPRGDATAEQQNDKTLEMTPHDPVEVYGIDTGSAKGVKVKRTLGLKFQYAVLGFVMLYACLLALIQDPGANWTRIAITLGLVSGWVGLWELFTPSFRVRALIDGSWVKVGDFTKSEALALSLDIKNKMRSR